MPGSRRRNGANASPTSPDEMQGRIDRLESLVLSLMGTGAQAGSSAAGPPASATTSRSPTFTQPSHDTEDSEMDGRIAPHEDSDVESMSRSIGVMKVANDRQFYASEAHWWAILSDISEVKSYFAEHKKQFDDHMRKVKDGQGLGHAPGLGMLFKGVSKLEPDVLLARFPQRPVANALISRYFDSENPAARILHRPTFRRQYERHWQNPQSSSMAWLSMCFAMMCLALQSYHRAGDEPEELKGQTWLESLKYLELTIEALVTTDFTMPVGCMIETLCLYLQAEHNRSKDSETGVWILGGIMTRLALRMGLHRDPAPYAALSPFQGEMRRRVWAFVRASDVYLSFTVGLPPNLRHCDTDCKAPANIEDDLFDETSKVIPPGRPLGDVTPMSYMILQCEFVFQLGKIMEVTGALAPPQYDTITKLDEDLLAIRDQVPVQLRLKSREESALDSASTLMQRHIIDMLFYKCQLVLHRKFLSRARENPRYAYSRRTCIDAALAILQHQDTMHVDCQPGGRMASVGWSTSTAICLADFLLSSMIVCLDLYHTAQSEAKGHTSGELYTWALERREAMFASIERSVVIWESMKDISIEAFKASTVLHVMLQKLKAHQQLRTQLNSNFSFAIAPGGLAPDGPTGPEQSAAMTLGLMSQGGMGQNQLNLFERNQYGPQRTGLTPQPPATGMDGQQGLGGGPTMDPGSPFSNLFANIGGFQGMDIPLSASDWVSFHSSPPRRNRWLTAWTGSMGYVRSRHRSRRLCAGSVWL